MMSSDAKSSGDRGADTILIRGLELPVLIGVPDEERESWQTLRADLELELRDTVESMNDRIEATVDYDLVARRMRLLAAAKPRCLIETLAGEMAAELLASFCLKQVSITLRKRILPGVDDVGIRITRAI